MLGDGGLIVFDQGRIRFILGLHFQPDDACICRGCNFTYMVNSRGADIM